MSYSQHRGDNLIDYLNRELKVKQMELYALQEITQAINNNFSAQDLFRLYELTLKTHLRIERAIVFVHDEQWYPISHYGVSEEVRLLEVDKLMAGFRQAHQFEMGEERPAGLEGFDIIIPVLHKNKSLAYALLAYPKKESYETMQEKVSFIETITNIIVVAIENKRLFKKQLETEGFKRELEVARQVQTMLIPDDLPNTECLEMAAVYLPHRNVGGDYYDHMDIGQGRHVICIADISGKGIGAALLMANFQAHLSALLRGEEMEMDEFIRKLNTMVLDITRGQKFITFFIGCYDRPKGELRYVNAGHNPPLLYMNGEAHFLEEGCTILGMFDELPFVNMGRIPVSLPATAILYTDGLTDLENDEGLNYSTDHLVDFVKRNTGASMQNLNRKLLEEIRKFKGEQLFVDDISVLSIQFKELN